MIAELVKKPSSKDSIFASPPDMENNGPLPPNNPNAVAAEDICAVMNASPVIDAFEVEVFSIIALISTKPVIDADAVAAFATCAARSPAPDNVALTVELPDNNDDVLMLTTNEASEVPFIVLAAAPIP